MNCIHWNGSVFSWRASLWVCCFFFPLETARLGPLGISRRGRRGSIPERRQQMRQTLIEAHVPLPDFNALFLSTVEFSCGLLLVLGAVTPLACALLAFLMIVAIATTAIRCIKVSSPAEWLAAFLYLPEPLYLVILIWLFFSGPGWPSVDNLLLSQTRF